MIKVLWAIFGEHIAIREKNGQYFVTLPSRSGKYDVKLVFDDEGLEQTLVSVSDMEN